MRKLLKLKDLLIILPGLCGSVLQRNRKDIWAVSTQAVIGGMSSLGGSLRFLEVDRDDPEVDDLGDGIRATEVIIGPYTVPGLAKFDGYGKLIDTLSQAFTVIRGSVFDNKPANLITFPYDWRRHNRAAARQLKRLIDRRLPQWREFSGASDAQVILLAHSMGGLISRYYLEVLDGWPTCKALITFGTPFLGSVGALNYLANGYKMLSLDLTEIIRSFPSTYELLPTFMCVHDGIDYKLGALKYQYKYVADTDGIPGVDRTRAVAARIFHEEIERAIKANNEALDDQVNRYTLIPYIGTDQPTLQSAVLEDGRLVVDSVMPVGPQMTSDEWALLEGGDGTVPRLSASPPDLWGRYYDSFVPERHAAIQRNDRVLSDLLQRLATMQLPARVPKLGPQITVEPPAISLEVDDLYLPSEPVVVRATLRNVDPAQSYGPLVAAIESAADDQKILEQPMHSDDGTWVLRLDMLPPGLYRVTVSGHGSGPNVPSVHDLFDIAG